MGAWSVPAHRRGLPKRCRPSGCLESGTSSCFVQRMELRGLEQRLPAGEQLLQLVAGGAVLGQRVHVRPVLRQLRLELGDVLLERRDPALDLLELGRALLLRRRAGGPSAPSARPRRPRAARSSPRAPGRGRPSRRRRSAACAPRPRRCARRPRRAARGRGRRAGSSPGNASSAASSASRLSRSRWLVGSSSTRKFAPEATIAARASRRRSPPESTETCFSCSA